MVDGANVGDVVVGGIGAKGQDGKKYDTDYLSNKYNDADMIVVEIGSGRKEPVDEFWANEEPNFTDGENSVVRFNAWVLYGNQVVSTKIFEKSIWKMKQTTGKQKDLNPKIIWAHRKPYILSGV